MANYFYEQELQRRRREHAAAEARAKRDSLDQELEDLVSGWNEVTEARLYVLNAEAQRTSQKDSLGRTNPHWLELHAKIDALLDLWEASRK